MRKGSGLAELADVHVRHNSRARNGSVVLALGWHRFVEKLSPRWNLDVQLTEFAVPVFAA